MNLKEYQALAMRTSPDGHNRILNGCMGLIGESGEIVDAVKKWRFQSGDNAVLPVDKLIDECGDVLWYCAELATGLDIHLEKIYDTEVAAHIFNMTVETQDICVIAVKLSQLCGLPFLFLVDGVSFDTNKDDKAQFYMSIIIYTIFTILYTFCNSSLNTCMERNIEKLRKRYPDGFDPERSLHRAE